MKRTILLLILSGCLSGSLAGCTTTPTGRPYSQGLSCPRTYELAAWTCCGNILPMCAI